MNFNKTLVIDIELLYMLVLVIHCTTLDNRGTYIHQIPGIHLTIYIYISCASR